MAVVRAGVVAAGLVALALLSGCSRPRAAIDAPAGGSALEAAMRAVPVAMYVTAWCPVCAAAREWMDARGYRYVEYDVERDPGAELVFRSVNPRGSVPMFDVDGVIVIGFDARALQRELRRAAARRPFPSSG